MNQLRSRGWRLREQGGFTLVEALVTVAIIGILAALALPSYSKFVNRSRARSAASDLVGLSLVLENVFQKTLNYPSYPAGTVIPPLPENRSGTLATDFGAWAPAESAFFTYSISSTNVGYTVTANEQNNLKCSISISNGNARTVTGPDCGFTSW